MSLFAKHSRHLRFTALLIPLFLVFVGMRVPDISRPQKPKPLRRAVLDKSPARAMQQSVAKADATPLLTNPPDFPLPITRVHLSKTLPIRTEVPPLSLSPSTPRAPPSDRCA